MENIEIFREYLGGNFLTVVEEYAKYLDLSEFLDNKVILIQRVQEEDYLCGRAFKRSKAYYI